MRKADLVVERPPVNPHLFLLQAMDTAGLAWFIYEAGRNPFVHADARRVWFNTKRVRNEPVLEVIDDGTGMDARGRQQAGQELGWSKEDKGIGTGVRQTAFTLARYLEFITVPKDEPRIAYRIKLPLARFLMGLYERTWKSTWDRVPREQTPFPESSDLPHGTMLLLSDFRSADPIDPENPAKMVSTASQITPENVIVALAKRFPPDMRRCMFVNGNPVPVKKFEGRILWREAPKTKPGLGIVSGEVGISETLDDTWLVLGGTTGTIPFANFLEGCRDHNPALAARIPRILRNRQLDGFVRIEVLERHPTAGRMKLRPHFYTSEAGQLVVDELIRIAAKVEEAHREYQDEPVSHVTDGLLDELVARVHAAKGIDPTTAPGGEPVPGEVPGTAPIPRLSVIPQRVRLELWDGKDERDSSIFVIVNPLPGETFEWDDQGVGLLMRRQGAQIEARAIQKSGVYNIVVRSLIHPSRESSVTVTVKEPEEQVTGEDVFRVVPQATQIETGEEKTISVRSQGQSSGNYRWTVELESGGSAAKFVTLTVLPGSRQVRIVARRHGRYLVKCIDRENPDLVAVSRVEVLARRRTDDGPIVCGPPTAGPTSVLVPGPGTGGEERPSKSGRHLIYPFGGRVFRVGLRGDPLLREPLAVDLDNEEIVIADRVAARFEEPEARRRHVVATVTDGLLIFLMDQKVIGPEDHMAFVEVVDDMLTMNMLPRSDNGNGP